MKLYQNRIAGATAALFLFSFFAGSVALTVPANAQTTAEMNERANRDYDKADKAMNSAYKKLLGRLNKKAKARLKKAQIAWLKFQDAEADFLDCEIEDGEGTIQGVIHPSNLQEITEKRTRELNAAYKNFTTEG